MLYLGRRDTGKNTHLLIDAFERCVLSTRSELKLVLAGPSELPVKPASPAVIDMGLVSDAEKINLIKHCLALVNPSANESFSRVVFEAWFAGKPVLLNRLCPATSRLIDEAGGGGWIFDGDVTSLVKCIEELEANSREILDSAGAVGLKYAQKHAGWGSVIDSYLREIQLLVDQTQDRGDHSLLASPTSRLTA